MTSLQPPSHVQTVIEQYLLPLPEKVQVAIALAQGDKAYFVGAERTMKSIDYLDNRSAVFEIGSISKVFAATLLAYAVEQGNLRLDTPVQELLPFKLKQSQRDGVAVTLKQLANHTSGIAHHQPPWLGVYAFLRGHPREPFQYLVVVLSK